MMQKSFMGYPLYVERKHNKNMYLRLEKDGTLYITCPYFTSDADILKFLNEKQKWIARAEKRLNEADRNTLTGEDGKTAVLLGKQYAVNIVSSVKNSMSVNDEEHMITYHLKDQKSEVIRKLFYKYGNQVLARMIAERRGRLDRLICVANNKQLPHITIRYTTSQWGSCTPGHHAISISSRLIHYPSGCLDYVLTHEYAHILVPNHSASFYSVVERYMPDWKTYSDMLKQR